MTLIRYSSVSLCRSQSTVEAEKCPPGKKANQVRGLVAGYRNRTISIEDCAIKIQKRGESHDLSRSNNCSCIYILIDDTVGIGLVASCIMYETIAKADGDVTVNGHAPKIDFEVLRRDCWCEICHAEVLRHSTTS